jgi:hypothetical protein
MPASIRNTKANHCIFLSFALLCRVIPSPDYCNFSLIAWLLPAAAWPQLVARPPQRSDTAPVPDAQAPEQGKRRAKKRDSGQGYAMFS